MITDRLDVDAGDLAARTGWDLKPQGACKGDLCVPLPPEVRTAAGRVDVTVLAPRLGMPLLADETHGVWALGPDSVAGRALVTAEAPDVTLPDVDGRPFRLADLRGKKVVLAAWASW